MRSEIIAKCVFNGCTWERAFRFPIVGDEDIAAHSIRHVGDNPDHLVQIFAFNPAEADELAGHPPRPEDDAALSVCCEPACEDPVEFIVAWSDGSSSVQCKIHSMIHRSCDRDIVMVRRVEHA